MDLISTAYSDTSPEYVTLHRPELGNMARIRLRVHKKCRRVSVYLRVILDGIDHFIPATKHWQDESFCWYEASVAVSQPRITYHFRLHRKSETYYLTRAGLSTVYPTEEQDFLVDIGADAPQWAKGAVFYQIFPDRFCNGDKSLNVTDGEITRDGFASREMTWGRAPLPYPESGSLDFFNGDLPGIEQRLDYLHDLGVSALYINPIFLAKTNHRYDCLDYFTVDPHLGGDEALISLVRSAHKIGIRIIVDVSINHIGKEHAWAKGIPRSDGSQADVIARDPSGDVVHWMGVPELLKLDYQSPELCDHVFRRKDSLVQKYLHEPFSIDGWRFDVASETGNNGAAQAGHALWREIRCVVKSINSEAYILGEHWQDALAYLDGDEWDSAMNYFASGRAIRMWVGEADPLALERREEGVPGRPIHGTELGQLIRQHFDRVHSNLMHAQFNLIDSHDVTRLHNNQAVFDWNVYSGAVALLFFLPGAVNIYYGDELGIAGTLDGDHGKRFPMPWDKDHWDPRFVNLYRELIALKRDEAALQHGGYMIIVEEEDLFVIARLGSECTLLLVLNRLAEDRAVEIPTVKLGARTARVIPLLGQEARDLNLSSERLLVQLTAGESAVVACSR